MDSRKMCRTWVLVLTLLVSACSAINPHVRPTQRHPWQDTARTSSIPQLQSDSQNDLEFAGGMNEAIRYANSMREAYYKAVGEQTLLRNGLAATLIPLSAAALFLGITDIAGPNAIAGLAISGAGLYGIGIFLSNPSLQQIYLLGSQAVGCAILSMRPFLMTRTTYNAVTAALEAMPGQIAAVHDAIADVEANIAAIGLVATGAPVSELIKGVQEDISRARTLIERTHVARANGNRMVDNVTRASLTLVTNVDNVRDMVSLEIARKEPTLSSVTTIVAGLSSLSSTFTPRPDGQPLSPTLPTRSQIERQSRDVTKTPRVSELVEALIQSRSRLNTTYSSLIASVLTIEQAQERIQTAQAQINTIEQCRPQSAQTELTTVPPGPFRIPGGTGTTRFIIQGGKAPYRAELLQEPVAGLEVRERPAFSAHVEVTAKNAAEGSYSALITDGTGSTTIVGLEIGAAAVSPAVQFIPSSRVPLPSKTSQPPLPPPQQPEDAFLSQDQKKMVQRRLCVKDDGDFGQATRRAIREYQESVGKPKPSSGVLDAEQAETILNLKECPRQFQTYYELYILHPVRAVAYLQRQLNEAHKRGIISLRRPLTITDELNTSTREALKSYQVKSGVSPADGLYSLKTFNAIIQIPAEGSLLEPDR